MRIVERAFSALERLVTHTIKMEELNSSLTKNRLETMADLYKNHVTVLGYQAWMHMGTAVLGGTAGAMASRVSLDAATAASLATKCGDGATTMERGKEKGIEGELAAVNHKVSKGSEANKRTSEILQQFVQNVRTTCDLLGRQNSPAT